MLNGGQLQHRRIFNPVGQVASKPLKRIPRTPQCYNLLRSISWLTVSNALARSRITPRVEHPSS